MHVIFANALHFFLFLFLSPAPGNGAGISDGNAGDADGHARWAVLHGELGHETRYSTTDDGPVSQAHAHSAAAPSDDAEPSETVSSARPRVPSH